MSHIFDLDGTLYQNKELKEEINKRTTNWIRKELGKSREETQELVMKTKETYPNIYNGLEALGLSSEKYCSGVFKSISPQNYLSEDKQLREELKKNSTNYIVSFSPISHIENVLEALEIKGLFKEINSMNEYNNNSKKVVYRRLKPEAQIVIGDNFRTDLLPAQELELNTIHVKEGCRVEERHNCKKNILEAMKKSRIIN